MSSGQIRRVIEQQDTSKSGILFVVVRTRRAAFPPCCFHRAISPSCDFAVSRFCRVAISPSCDFTVRFHRIAISPSDFTVWRFHHAAISPSAISPCDSTVWRFHCAAISPNAISPCRDVTMLLLYPRDPCIQQSPGEISCIGFFQRDVSSVDRGSGNAIYPAVPCIQLAFQCSYPADFF